jgi:mannose-6-phosphate isomerase
MSNKIKVFGENKLNKLDLSLEGRQNFADGEYVYYYYTASKKTSLKITELKSFSVFVLEIGDGLKVLYDDHQTRDLNKFDAIQVENQSIEISTNKNALFIVAGTYQGFDEFSPRVSFFSENQLYRVSKPWGYEVWVNGKNHPGYSLKKIRINKGTKTSLQYHQYKKETNVVYEGKAIFHYKKNKDIKNDDVTSEDIGQENIEAVTSIDVSPNIIHRIESITSILLYEVSTPHLDDVIRLQDDVKRANGKILEEHIGND